MCPYSKYAPRTEQGWQAWEVFLKCHRQVRTVFDRIVGVDQIALYQTCDALGYNKQELVHLLEYCEQGFMEALENGTERK